LLKNQDGLFIAVEQADAAAFRAHYENVPTLPDEDLDSFQETLDAMMGPIKSALQGQGVTGTPNPEFEPRLKALETQIKEAEKPFRDSIPAIEAILTAAKDRGQRGSQTLQSVLDDMKEAESITRAARIEASRKKAEDEVTQQLAKAEADRVLAVGERERTEVTAETARVQAQANEIELQKRAKDPETLKRLAPFVGKGKTIFQCANTRSHGWANLSWLESEGNILSSKPMSLNALICYGALEPTEAGLSRLCELAVSVENDRPRWTRDTADPNSDWVKENQLLLRDLGVTLVKEELLLP
jgi:hypothetical protein